MIFGFVATLTIWMVALWKPFSLSMIVKSLRQSDSAYRRLFAPKINETICAEIQ